MKNVKNFIKDIIEFLNGFKNMVSSLCTKGKRVKQIPNLLTLSRVGFALIIPPLAMTGSLIPAAILTICAALTDAVDGFVARKLDAVSEFGKNLDPVCDKIFAGALLLPLIGKLNPLLSLGLCANVALELGIAGVNLKSKAKGNVPRTTILGKIKTGMLSALIASLYASFSYQAITSIIPIIYALATATQAMTLVDYQRIDKKKDAKRQELKGIDATIVIENPDNSGLAKTMDKSVVDYFISKEQELPTTKSKEIEINNPTPVRLPYEPSIYSSDDYKNLKEEVIRTKTSSTQSDILPVETKDGFQKTK